MPKKRILIVEDEPVIGEAIAEGLEEAGYEADYFADGDQALASFDEHRHGLVVTDVVMPNREGFDLLREFKKRAPGTGVVVISGGGRFVTGDSLLELAERLGADATLAKPFRVAELVRLVKELDRRIDLAALHVSAAAHVADASHA
jgi:DNA-binding response OmpR family regulator